ncbi:MAG: choice-of-anchor L domain-containing protein [Actinomycetota bacterium]|nr:choice-of-anchor L domain-containing protein [Actinomycetota bacterium]
MSFPARRITAAAVLLAGVAVAAPASAAIVEYPLDPSATPIAKAMARDPALVRRAVFSALPPSSKPAAVSTTRLGGFPTSGSSFGILSTGNAKIADDPNSSTESGSESRGPAIRGARDVVIMRVDLRVPRGANCLSFDFRFLSEEFPEFVGEIFNDAFIAELGISNWDASGKEDPTITAPNNFARDTKGNPIRVNRVGDTTVSAGQARGTTFDGATRRLRASTRVKPGNRRLYLSIFDQGDRDFDSAVFVDNLRASKASSCQTGVRASS